jgi:acyl-coenzyme A synthetase/AMP-(fatty) acid ligase
MYWNDHQKSKRTFSGDWIYTGDLFEHDRNGYFWYHGRADDLLKVGGIWVAPLEIEHCLLEHPDVLECAVVGFEKEGLTIPCAWVVLSGGSQASEATAMELQDFVRSRLSPHKYPREVRGSKRGPPSGG